MVMINPVDDIIRFILSDRLSWSLNTSHLVKNAQQKLFFLRKLKQAKLPSQLLSFYKSTIESIFCYCAMVWYASCTVENRKDLVQVAKPELIE